MWKHGCQVSWQLNMIISKVVFSVGSFWIAFWLYSLILSFKIKKITKKLGLCRNPKFTINPYVFETRCHRPLIFKTIKSVRSNNLSLTYLRITLWGWKDIGIRKLILWRKLKSFIYNSRIQKVLKKSQTLKCVIWEQTFF